MGRGDHWRKTEMTTQTGLGGSYTFAGSSMTLNRMGYGAMQLAGPQVWGPPRDVDGAMAVLKEAVASGVNHIENYAGQICPTASAPVGYSVSLMANKC
jgi:hypothetical protein